MTVSVLLIESSDEHADAVRGALADSWLAWKVQAVKTLQQARASLAQSTFDVALVSYQLTDGAAYDVLADLRTTPVLIVVPAGLEAQAAHGLRHGFADFIVWDAAGQFLLALPSQIEAVLERARGAQSREAAEQLLARQHRLLQAIFRAQALFIASAPARETFEALLSELLALTESQSGFLGQVETSPVGGRLLRIHAITEPAGDAAPRTRLQDSSSLVGFS